MGRGKGRRAYEEQERWNRGVTAVVGLQVGEMSDRKAVTGSRECVLRHLHRIIFLGPRDTSA